PIIGPRPASRLGADLPRALAGRRPRAHLRGVHLGRSRGGPRPPAPAHGHRPGPGPGGRRPPRPDDPAPARAGRGHPGPPPAPAGRTRLMSVRLLVVWCADWPVVAAATVHG